MPRVLGDRPSWHHDSVSDPVLELLCDCRDEMLRLADSPETRAGARRFAEALASATPSDPKPCLLPALESRHLLTSSLGRRLADVADTLPWVPTMRATDEGSDYALCVLSDVYDLGDVTAGFMYIDVDQQYPEHNHAPQELYLTVSGDGLWRYGGSEDAEVVPAGSVFYNHPRDIHWARTPPGEPLLALYVLWP